MLFPPPKSSDESSASPSYREAVGRPEFVFPPPQKIDPSTPYAVAEQVAGVVNNMQDGITALNGRVDLMEQVSGYAGMVMSTSPAVASGDIYQRLPFDTEYGPAKNATVDPTVNRINLAKGTWSLTATIATKEHGGSNPVWNRGYFMVKDPGGGIFQRRWLDWTTIGPPFTAQFQTLVIAPEPGYFVEFWYTHNAGFRRTVLGGVDRSAIWANRWDIDTKNAPTFTNPPEVNLG